jgi:hypothetical protein
MSHPTLSDPTDPTPEDLRLWAYTPDAEYPDEMPQDWDLCVISFERAPLLLEFAADAHCPNRHFFLACLYTLAGDCVRSQAGGRDIPRLRALLASIPADGDRLVSLWAQRTEYLLAHPESYDYNRWGWGDFAMNESDGFDAAPDTTPVLTPEG